ncbi:hypothetical protein GEMRC1_012057 [Eukaryota sp. GEM-RC1]
MDTSLPARPPQNVIVMGPPKTGKSVLIHSLIKCWTKRSLNSIEGPITIVLGQKNRVTLFECPNELGAMIDLAKISDIAIIVVDCKTGFEMEHMEFLNLLQNHGFCRVACVLTNCDAFKKQSSLRKRIKELKERFRKEVADGAKLVHFSKLVHGTEYPRKEVAVFARHIANQKSKPTVWRASHPFVLVDRWDDVSPSNHTEDSRRIAAYGWIRGGHFLPGTFSTFHAPGLGDFDVEQVDVIDDPIPPPSKARYLLDRDRLVYAPRGDIGNGIVVEKESIYIKLPNQNNTKLSDDVIEGQELIRSLRESADVERDQSSDDEFSDQPVEEFGSEPSEDEDDVEDQNEDQIEEEMIDSEMIDDQTDHYPFERVKEEVKEDDVSESEFSEVEAPDSQSEISSDDESDESSADEQIDEDALNDIDDDLDEQHNEQPSAEDADIDNSDFSILKKKDTSEEDNLTDIISAGGLPIGSYLRIVLKNVPSSYLELPNTTPIILGVVPVVEKDTDLGPVWTKAKKHRWYNRLLKSNDPIVISMGWRRFQTRGVLSRTDLGNGLERHRYLKYTPEHEFCNFMFTSPCFPPNTPFVGFLTDRLVQGFRIAMTGVLLENRPLQNVVKKLKVVGEPVKIMKRPRLLEKCFHRNWKLPNSKGQ